MRKGKFSPAVLLAYLALAFILMYMILGASGFRGLLPGSNHFRSKGERGFYVFYRLLEELGYDIRFERRYTLPEGEGSCLVYLDMNETDEETAGLLMDWVEKGNSMILFDGAIDRFFRDDAVLEAEGGKDFSPEFLDKLTEPLILPRDDYGGVAAVSLRAGKGRLLLLADRSPFSNGALKEGDGAVDLDRIFYSYRDSPVFLREKSTEALFDPSLIKGLLKGKLSFLVVHMMGVFLFLILMSGKRFSREPGRKGKQVRMITEHLAAVGLFYHRAGASVLIERADAPYFKWVICKGKKPALLSPGEYEELSCTAEGLDEEEILERFRRRNEWIEKIRKEHEL